MSSCTVCGNEYVMGSNWHTTCREIEQLRNEREAEINKMLHWWRTHKDCCPLTHGDGK